MSDHIRCLSLVLIGLVLLIKVVLLDVGVVVHGFRLLGSLRLGLAATLGGRLLDLARRDLGVGSTLEKLV